MPSQQSRSCLHLAPNPLHPRASALALLANPNQASAIPAMPTPNFLSAARRVTDWAMLFVNSSNLLFIVLARVTFDIRTEGS